MQHLVFIFTDKLMIFFRNFGVFLITNFGIYLVYNLEHFGIFYCANLATLIKSRKLTYLNVRPAQCCAYCYLARYLKKFAHPCSSRLPVPRVE